MSSDVRKPLDLPHPSATPYSRTLKQYSIDEKLTIISHAKNHGNRAAGREFNVAESSIREWRKNETKLIHNKANLAAGLATISAQSSSQPSPAIIAAARANHLHLNQNIINNNNNNNNKNGDIPHHMLQQGGIFRLLQQGGIFRSENNGVSRRSPEEFMKLVQLAMLNMDFSHLGPFLQLQHQHRLLQSMTPSSHVPPIPIEPSSSSSTSSSVSGTPSSVSSSSTPPPSPSQVSVPSGPASGSGRRKPKCPQKIVPSEGAAV